MRSLPVAVSVSDLSLSARRQRLHRQPGGTPTPTVGVCGRSWRGTAHAPLASVQSSTLRSEIVFMTDRFIFWNILHHLLRQSSSWWLGALRLLTLLTHCVRNFWAKKNARNAVAAFLQRSSSLPRCVGMRNADAIRIFNFRNLTTLLSSLQLRPFLKALIPWPLISVKPWLYGFICWACPCRVAPQKKTIRLRWYLLAS